MSKVALTLAATSVGLGLVSLHLVKQLREGDATIAQLQAQVATLEKQAQAATAATVAPTPTPFGSLVAEQPAAPGASNDVAQKDVSKSAAVRALGQAATLPQAPQIPGREEQMRMMREHRERQRQLMQDPEYREAMRLQARNNMARQYPGVIEELGLDQHQADDFFGILAEQQLRANELMSSLWENGESSDPTAAQERHREAQQTVSDLQRKSEADLAARFGQDKLQAWKEYQSTMGMRFHLDHMRSTLASQGLALSEDMSKPMLKALAEVQKAEVQEHTAGQNRLVAGPGMTRLAGNQAFEGNNMERQIEQIKKRNQRMLDAISPYLTYEQRTAIEKEQQAQLKMQEAQLRLMRASGSNANVGFYAEGSTQLIRVQP